MRVLVFNPNTTTSMTETAAVAGRAAAGPGTTVVGRTADMGPVSIEGYYDEVFAVPAVITAAVAAEAEGYAGMVVACFDDTGVDAARCRVGIPVVGICEAGLLAASPLAKRIAVVTTQARAKVPLTELVHRYGFADRVTVYAADIPVLALEDPSSGAREKIESEMTRALEAGAEAVLLGCAGMADLADSLQERFGVPVIDGVSAAVTVIEGLARIGRKTSKRGTYAPAIAKTYVGALAGFAPP